jgi:uracil-DNA glycosylase family 4
MEALAWRTISGALIDEIVGGVQGLGAWRTNLVDCVLIDASGKPRNPTTREVVVSFPRFKDRIQKHKPRIVIALGALTSRHILSELAGIEFSGWAGSLHYEPVVRGGTAYIAAHHPSHIAVYRRRDRKKYVESLQSAIEKVLKQKKI